jgi:signal transduction histidine kinase
VVTVTDDGRGGDIAGAAGAGLGIAGMRSRVEALGGVLEAGPAPGGFAVRARIPLGAAR